MTWFQIAQAEPQGNISFMPNVIPELTIHFVEEFFRFEWLSNRFDLKLLIHIEGKDHSLKDFWELTDRRLKWGFVKEQATESMYEFGYMIEDIPQEIADNVEYLVWKIEGASFDISEIALLELGENDTKIFLPDNLVLSYEDLWLYDFTVSHPNKHETIVKGVKGKTAWNLDPITYSDTTITVTGYTEGTPCTFWDVWNASNVNGWGAVFNYDNMTYFFNGTKLEIDSGGWFADTNVHVQFNTTSEIAIFNDSSNFRLGTLEDSANKVTSGGVSVLFDLAGGANDVAYYADSSSVTEFYGCTMSSQSHQSRIYVYHASSYTYLYNTMFVGLLWQMYQPHSDLYRFTQMAQSLGSGGGVYNAYSSDANFSDISVSGNLYAIYGTTGTMTNLVARNNTYLIYCWHVSQPNVYLINPDVDVWNVRLVGGYTNEVYRQYTFDLTVTYPNGTAIQNANVTVKHYGQGETQDFSELTDSNGQISQKTLSMGFYNSTGGNTIYNYNPYELTVTYIDYQTYTQNFTLDNQITWEISLIEEAETQLEPGSGINEYVKAVIVEPNIRGILIIVGLFAIVHWIYKWLTNKPKRWAKKAKITRY